ncbi:MAG: nucleotide sugar dehydrogenase [Candidatus Thorarchaeota archaeon]|nr:nucleotide sugar dehydrogenase [Candidatus Thorarchaeota archaeon]
MTKDKVAVVGLGYVGIPVAAKFAEAGFQVVGIDLLKEKVDRINNGECPIEGDEPGLADLLRSVVASGQFRATTDYKVIRDAEYVLIVVQTPFDLRSKEPYYSALRSASKSVGENLGKGALVIVESTVSPGTTQNIVQPILESKSGLKAGVDFWLAAAPERVMPGKLLHNLESVERVVGGLDELSTQKALDFYRHIVKSELHPTDILTAEIVKTTENAYRDVQIAFANEVALLCEIVGADVYEVRRLVNLSPQRQMHLPGAGVGGHCIPKDSWLLAFAAKDKYQPRLLATSREINDGMPIHMSNLVESALHEAGRPVYGSTATILGIAYLENSDDTRNSPAFNLVKALEVKGVFPVVHDPYVREANGIRVVKNLNEALKDSDCMVLVTAHEEYRHLDLDAAKKLLRTPIIVDGRNVFDKKACVEKGFVFRGVGQGK